MCTATRLGRTGSLALIGAERSAETAQALRDIEGEKWLCTGDVAKIDEDGYLTIVDRTKCMIDVSGYEVFSREAETTLYGNPNNRQSFIGA